MCPNRPAASLRVLALVAVLAFATVGVAAAGGYVVAPLALASAPSPFAACTAGGPGTVYPNAEVEPRVAVNPTDPGNIVGVYQQDRWSDGGARGLVTAVSHD